MPRLVSEIQKIALDALKDLAIQVLTSTVYSISDERADELDSVLVKLARRTSSGPVFLASFIATRDEFYVFVARCRSARIWVDYDWMKTNSDKFIYAIACKEMRP